MKNLMKFVGLVGLSLICSASAMAAQPWATGGASSVFEVGASTPAVTAVLVSAGAGQLSFAEISSSTAGGYCTFVDSNTTAGITAANTDGTNTAPVLGRLWFTTANTPAYTPVNWGKPFNNGLVAICSHLSRLVLTGFRK